MVYNFYTYLLLLMATLCKALPKEIKKCHFGDEKCIVDSMNYVVKHYPKGIPEIGLKPIDVVDIGDLRLLETDKSRATWIGVNLTKQVNYGFENTTITKVEGFEKDPTVLTISGHIPSLVHKGLFDASGRVWLVALNISGESTSEFQKLRFTLKLKGAIEYRNNKRYFKIYELKPIVKIDRWILWMEDLFTENSDLTILVNRIFNDRWLEVWNEWETQILDSFSGVFLGMVKETFDRNSYDDLFLIDLL
ncbi:circadian clock-controlled protein-like [Drosophila innubila]|uniref:circadian clock-controlled protein-like n=1 Tax=Drosophila innubila TaxID=198719 RepID=UPI00148D569D|nr:circadian clock-controlled protein-like [Drosophila innubila]